jgi:hypothetical protein
VKHPRRPYLRPEEPTAAFDELADYYLRRYQPADPEMEALVNSLIYIAWRIQRYRLDEAVVELYPEVPGQPNALANTRSLIASLEQIYFWTLSTLEFWPRIHTLDASESMENKAIARSLGSLLQMAPDIPTPGTRPN